MNARIKQLAEQAGVTVLTTHGMEYVVDGCYVIGPARLEKFAEMIVKECAGVNYKSPFRDGEFHAREVLEHFGVE